MDVGDLEARLQNELDKEPDYEPNLYECDGGCANLFPKDKLRYFCDEFFCDDCWKTMEEFMWRP